MRGVIRDRRTLFQTSTAGDAQIFHSPHCLALAAVEYMPMRRNVANDLSVRGVPLFLASTFLIAL
jgi:hypothetical protein